MAEPLDGCRAKLDRADAHLDLFEREIDAFLEDESQSVALSTPISTRKAVTTSSTR